MSFLVSHWPSLCLAFGFFSVVGGSFVGSILKRPDLGERREDAYDRALVKALLDADKKPPVARFDDVSALLRWLG